ALTVGLGPNIFFVISGFLITLLFLRESQRTGTISIKGFYSRRIMRLTPVFAIFVLTIFAMGHLGWVHMPVSEWIHVLTYTVNFQEVPVHEVGHLWSLSIEEQFYLLWPITLLLLGQARA